MFSNDQSRPSPKTRTRKQTAASSAADSQTRAPLRDQAGDPWLNLGRRLASLIRVSRERLDDIYCSAAQFMTERKEAFEDRLSERKTQARAVTGPTQARGASARSTPRGTRGAIQDRTVQRSAAPLPSKSRPSAK
jgi:hypothetical protein